MIAETLRPLWVKGLNSITGKCENRLIDYISDRKGYVLYDRISADSFKLSIVDMGPLLRSYATDINRFGCASIESIHDVHYKKQLPNSHAWKCIKSYYAAYYAAHSILRNCGISCTNFERLELINVEKIADIYGQKQGIEINKGYYTCEIDTTNSKLICTRINAAGKMGSHEQLWSVFLRYIDSALSFLASLRASVEIQVLITKLYDLRSNLTSFGANGGNWLSQIRNEVNYKQIGGLWFPNRDMDRYFDLFPKMISNWSGDPMKIDLSNHIGKHYLRFLSTCVFIVSLNKSIASEMSKRCPKGHSFHDYGVLSLISHIKVSKKYNP